MRYVAVMMLCVIGMVELGLRLAFTLIAGLFVLMLSDDPDRLVRELARPFCFDLAKQLAEAPSDPQAKDLARLQGENLALREALIFEDRQNRT